jgi:hypothetical protein
MGCDFQEIYRKTAINGIIFSDHPEKTNLYKGKVTLLRNSALTYSGPGQL